MREFFEFIVEKGIIEALLVASIVALAGLLGKWFIFGEKNREKRRIAKLNGELSYLQEKLNPGKTDKSEYYSQTNEKREQITEKRSKTKNIWKGIVIIGIIILVLLFLILVIHGFSTFEKGNERADNKHSKVDGVEDDEKKNKIARNDELTSSPSPTLTLTPLPTELPTPSALAELINLPGSLFQEEGENKYGDLTSYLGITAGELIERIGKPYEYEYRGLNMETGVTGGLWFDQDVLFAFCDSEKTLDLSCRVYMVWVGSDSGIAKNIGNGLSAQMDFNALSSILGSNLSDAYEDMLNGGVSAGARCGDIGYSFHWNKGYDFFNPEKCPELIILYKYTEYDTY